MFVIQLLILGNTQSGCVDQARSFLYIYVLFKTQAYLFASPCVRLFVYWWIYSFFRNVRERIFYCAIFYVNVVGWASRKFAKTTKTRFKNIEIFANK